MMSSLTPFQQARWKLTVWYMVMFGALIGVFTYLTLQAKTSAYIRVYSVIDRGSPGSTQVKEFADTFERFNQTFKRRLFLFDALLFVATGYLSYLLSGKTLKPIQDMVEEQANFAADVSHSLRTPLATINMEIEAYRRTTKRVSRELTGLLQSIQEEIFSMTQLVAGMLTLVRSNNPVYAIEKTAVAVDELVKSVGQKIQPLAAAKHQHLTIMAPKPVTVKGNSDQLRQVLFILLDNAIKYSGPKSEVTIDLEAQQSVVKIRVSDTGKGIPKENLPHIFNRFYRADKKIKGTGLGLAIAAKLVAQHDGTIKVRSKEGQGTTFTVTLPRVGS